MPKEHSSAKKGSSALLAAFLSSGPTEAACIAALPVLGYALFRIVPHTEALCLAAVSAHPSLLKHVRVQTEAICAAAVSKDASAILFVHEPTSEMLGQALKRSPRIFQQVLRSPRCRALLTSEMCTAALIFDVRLFGKVPSNLQTEAMALAAVADDGRQLTRVAPQFLTLDVCRAALANDASVLPLVPLPLRTADLCLTAVRGNWSALAGDTVPLAVRTPELLAAAVEAHAEALQFIAPALLTPELLDIAVAAHGAALAFAPPALRTPALCAVAVRKSGFFIRDVPAAVQTLELCRAAVASDARAFLLIPAIHKIDLAAYAELLELALLTHGGRVLVSCDPDDVMDRGSYYYVVFGPKTRFQFERERGLRSALVRLAIWRRGRFAPLPRLRRTVLSCANVHEARFVTPDGGALVVAVDAEARARCELLRQLTEDGCGGGDDIPLYDAEYTSALQHVVEYVGGAVLARNCIVGASLDALWARLVAAEMLGVERLTRALCGAIANRLVSYDAVETRRALGLAPRGGGGRLKRMRSAAAEAEAEASSVGL